MKFKRKKIKKSINKNSKLLIEKRKRNRTDHSQQKMNTRRNWNRMMKNKKNKNGKTLVTMSLEE